MQVFVDRIDGNLDDAPVPRVAGSDFRSVSGRTRTQQIVAGAASDLHYARVLSTETTGENIAQCFGAFITRMVKVRIGLTLELRKGFPKDNDNLIGVVSARELVIVIRAAKAALAVNTGIAVTDCPSSDMFVSHLDKMVHGNCSTNANLSKLSAEARDKSYYQETVAHCVLVE